MHLFPKRVMSAFQRTTDIFNQRGTEYGDTWKHCTWLKFKAVAKELGCVIPDDACRALVAAGLADLKYFRFGGGYKEDNFDDGINYDGFTVEEVRHVKVERQLTYRKAESAAQRVEQAKCNHVGMMVAPANEPDNVWCTGCNTRVEHEAQA